jgi:hypothetical protein
VETLLLALFRPALGAGGKYLIQHSAGSGKTNSIARTAHFLSDLHDAADCKVFDSVLVVADRTVLDAQLQDAIFNSPDLAQEILNAVMDALTAHTTMSQQALDSPKVREGLKDILLGPAQLYESLQKMRPGGSSALTTAGPRQ